jgi:hypothetical protein
MSTPKRRIVVTRSYRPRSDNCRDALELLLKTSGRKKGGPATAPDDAKEKIKNVRATRIIRNPP